MLSVFLKGVGGLIGGAAGMFLEALMFVLGNVLLQKAAMRSAAFLVIGSVLRALARLTPTPADDALVEKLLADYKQREGADA